MIKRLVLLLAAIMPFNRLRIFFYRRLPGYLISYNSHIGWLNFIDVIACEIDRGHIGFLNLIRCRKLRMAPGSHLVRLNRIKNPNNVQIGAGSIIGTRNHFVGTREGLTPFKEHENIIIGRNTFITVGHLFDLSDTITIGDNVTFGGRGTEVWTHGFDVNHVKVQAPVTISGDVYVGSGCIFIQGLEVCGKVSIGAGTVVAKSITEPGFYVSSHLQRKCDAADYSTSDKIITHKNARFMRK